MSRKTRVPPGVNLNLNVRGLFESATLAINERSQRLREQGREVFRLGLGQSPFPVPRPVVEALQANAHQKDYLPVRGLAQLRQAVADYHRRRQNIEYVADDVLVGPGSKELMFIVQLVYYGDLVIPTPSWVSYAPQARIIGRQIRWVPTVAATSWMLTPDELEKICTDDPGRPRIVVLNYPSNPTGATFKADQLKELANVARRYRVVLLSDEIYGELHHKGQHVSIARYYPEGTIISTGLSKWCGAGGWRLGTFTFPRSLRWLLDAMAVVASESYTSTSAPIQYAAVRAFEGGLFIERYLIQCRRVLRTLCHGIVDVLRQAGAHVLVAKGNRGGFYLFPDFSPMKQSLAARGIRTSEDFANRLLEETGVALLPGSAFGRPPEELTARLAYVDFDGAHALAHAEQVAPDKDLDASFLATCCDNVVKAVQRIAEFVGKA